MDTWKKILLGVGAAGAATAIPGVGGTIIGALGKGAGALGQIPGALGKLPDAIGGIGGEKGADPEGWRRILEAMRGGYSGYQSAQQPPFPQQRRYY